MTTIPETETGWYSDDMATFGDRITGAREAAGLTQEELARSLGVWVSTIRDWEDDLLEPRANKLQMLAGLLNVSLRWVLTGEGEGVPAPGETASVHEIAELVVELRDVQAQLERTADRVAAIEARLRAAAGAAA